MKIRGCFGSLIVTVFLILCLFVAWRVVAQDAHFHNAPVSSSQQKNPYAGQSAAEAAGGKLYATDCASCHGAAGQGTGNIPPVAIGPTQAAPDGEIFWFITTGSVANGMPAWGSLSEEQRWQLVTFLKSLKNSPAATAAANEKEFTPVTTTAPPPAAPFVDFRFEAPGHSRKITPQDLPKPYATTSSNNGPKVVARPENAWPKAPAGFTVQLYATDLKNPRLIRTAPNGDVFLAESSAGMIKIFRGISSDGKPKEVSVFATKLKRPYGIAFYPPGPDPQWVYIGNTDAVVRFPYKNGDLKARGPAYHIVDLPHGGGHWTRSVEFSADGKKMFVAVGSASNVDDPDTTSAEKNRADIWELNPDGSGMRVYAYGIRNAGGGLAIHPSTHELWCSVNERDGLGDDLVPDYITHVQDGGFYGWPWWYIGGNQDPRHAGKHPELQNQTIVPDVLLQPHFASLEMAFYEGKQFPEEYQADLFAAQHGSWNRSVRTGYEVIRVPMHHSGRASGDFEDFLTGFVVDNGHVWGRPVGVAVASDGSLLVTDDGSNSIWRVVYTGGSQKSTTGQPEHHDGTRAAK
ncbi:MAG TPA: PQQ-dependent sugar dehydrogenase [Verrucomicrobiae bacterium]|nr:PQQ-dependent sugar dehydrogenase [Verrucomicrobiae bacterium]